MIGPAGRAALVIVAAATLAGCGSTRFGGSEPPIRTARATTAVPEPFDPIAPSVPSGSVTAEPLPPVGGSLGSGPVVADVPSAGAPVVASIEPPPAAVSAGPSRSASVGTYTAKDATGASCRINLSSSPALDLFRASASGCQNKDLSRVTAWDYREGEVYLYQPGGSVAARLRGSSASLSGVLAKSGAPLTLSR